MSVDLVFDPDVENRRARRTQRPLLPVFPSYEELLDAIDEMVTSIESETLTGVFEHWMERLEWVPKNNGDYHP
jgi:hypothetical protein